MLKEVVGWMFLLHFHFSQSFVGFIVHKFLSALKWKINYEIDIKNLLFLVN